ncbi:MAG: glycosyltransferase family 2 protein [Chloroflexi bacterium]|nr:glycosyltransferase family 2 protein [Chloroflexota bacterium]
MPESRPRRVIIMPAHNESKNIAAVLRELRPWAQGADIVVIDDYSSDETAALAAKMGAQVLSLPCNLRYGGAVQTGFKYAVQRGYDVAVMMDADGQHDPSAIPALLEVVESGQADVALGSRFLGRADYHLSLVRRWTMRAFAALVSRATRHPITDPTSGFQALNRDVLRFLARDNYPVDFPDADLLMLLGFAGFRIQEVPMVVRSRMSGTSMHAGLKPIYYMLKMMLSILIVWLRQKTRSNAVRPAPAEPSDDA